MKNQLNMLQISLIISTLATGMIAGLYYGYSCSVNPGLGKLSDTAYLSSMQSISIQIINPLFFASFMGTLFVLPVSMWLECKQGLSTNFYLVTAATLLYVIFSFGITCFCNVPLNDMLEKFVINSASATEQASMRRAFEMPWNSYHSTRTLATTASFILMIIACIRSK